MKRAKTRSGDEVWLCFFCVFFLGGSFYFYFFFFGGGFSVFHYGFMASRDYFTHFEPSQS